MVYPCLLFVNSCLLNLHIVYRLAPVSERYIWPPSLVSIPFLFVPRLVITSRLIGLNPANLIQIHVNAVTLTAMEMSWRGVEAFIR